MSLGGITGGGGGGGGSPTGAAGGDLSGNYPNPDVVNDSHTHSTITTAAGSLGAAPVAIVQAGTGPWQPATNVLGLQVNGIEAARFQTVASGVNYVDHIPSATGAAVVVQPGGSDATCSIAIRAKGIANVTIGCNGSDTWKVFGTSGSFSTSAQATGNPNISPNVASATNPVYNFVGDADTGIGRAAADALSLIAGALEVLRAAVGLGSANGPVLFIPNLTTAPSTNPVGGVYLYAEAGGLKARGSSGTVTALAVP